MSTYEFLSPEWQRAAEALRDEYQDRFSAPTEVVRVNIVVREAPFGEDALHAHIDSGRGHALPVEGHIADADMTVTMRYETVKALFVGRDPQAVQTAFFSGQIRVDGDMSRLLFLMDPELDETDVALASELDERLRAITS